MASRTRRRAGGAAALATAVVLPAVLAGPAGAQEAAYTTSAQLQADVTLDGVLRHIDRFQRIAENNDGNRAAGTPGYDASARYVYGQLQRAGLAVSYQDFEFRFFETTTSAFEQLAPTPTVYTAEGEEPTYSVPTYSGSGTAEGQVVEVDVQEPPAAEPGSTSGCEAEDFATFPAGAIALVQRGTCPFGVKAENAEAAGAAGVIIYNEGQEGRTDLVQATLGEDADIDIPVVGVSYATGRSLVGATVRVTVDAVDEVRFTRNVVAETRGGNAENVVMLGAHLDSVAEGPGINDNGSGSAALLEVARQYANDRTANKVRFAWWGAEELGLIGSTYYVDDLVANDPAGLEAIDAYLNFDMVASPNFARFVYDGDGSGFGLVGPAGSEEIEQTFTDYYSSRALPSEPTEFSGRSDYQAFIDNGIPAGGLFTGAEGVKTPEQAALYGGTADVAYDECYHEVCDTRTNLNLTALDENSDAIAHITATYGFSIAPIEAATAPAPAPETAGAASGGDDHHGPRLDS